MRIVNMEAFLEMVNLSKSSNYNCLPVPTTNGQFNFVIYNTHAHRLPQTNMNLFKLNQKAKIASVTNPEEYDKCQREIEENNFVLGQFDARDVMMINPNRKSLDDSPYSPFIMGCPVFSCNSGRVVYTSNDMKDGYSYPDEIIISKPFGNFVLIEQKDGYMMYAHLQQGSIKVRPKQGVSKGQQIACVGHSGNSSDPHLHFGMYADLPVKEQGYGFIKNGYAQGKELGRFDAYTSWVLYLDDATGIVKGSEPESQYNPSGSKLHQCELI